MENIKIIFFDIDGTLIDMTKKKISEKMLETLKILKNNGIKLCVATGRSPMQVPQFPNIEFDAYLTYNGSYCFSKDKTIFSNPLKKYDVNTILKNAKKMNRPVSLATQNRLAANGTDQDLSEYYGFSGIDVVISDDFDDVVKNDDIYQMMMGCYPEDYEQVLKNVKDAKIAAWWNRAIDIIPANGGKGVAIEKVIEDYHLTQEEAMAFGDGNNDIEMLKTVGLGVAMKNGSDELKKIADDICEDVKQDGIYLYCLEKGLI